MLYYNLILQFVSLAFLLGIFSLQRNWEMLKRRTSRSMPLWTRPWASSTVSKEDLEPRKKSLLFPSWHPHLKFFFLCVCTSDSAVFLIPFSRSTGRRAHQANQQKCCASQWFKSTLIFLEALIGFTAQLLRKSQVISGTNYYGILKVSNVACKPWGSIFFWGGFWSMIRALWLWQVFSHQPKPSIFP